jgi:hypothetical protein
MGKEMKPSSLSSLLAYASLFLAVLLPGEAYPDGRLAVLVAATFVFFTSLMEGRIRRGYIVGGLAVFAGLLIHTTLFSVDLYRSLEFLTVLWSYYCLAGFFAHTGFPPLKPVAIVVVLLAVVVSGYGIYQYLWGFQELYSFVMSSTSGEIVKEQALTRIVDRRVFSTFALPGTLWGFLVVTLPFHAALWSQRKFWNGILLISSSLVLTTGFLTRSFGFLFGLLILTAAWLLIRHRRLLWNRFAAIAIVVAIIGITFYSVRREVIEGSNPVSLRFMNWVSAWSIFAANPAGTGLNTYGVMYSRHMLPGANETQYTHNTPLQLLSELGYPLLIAAACTLLLLVSRRRTAVPRTLSPWLLIALVVWLGHNLVDINVYFPSIGIFGAVLLGAIFWREQPTHRTSPALQVAIGAFSLALLVFSSFVMLSTELQNRAKAEFEENRLAEAAATLSSAKALMPINSSLHYEEGNVLLHLFHSRKDQTLLQGATAAFRTAIKLSPEKSGPYSGLGLCLASANQVDAALEEIFHAQQRYPDSTELQAIRRLLTKRRLGSAD